MKKDHIQGEPKLLLQKNMVDTDANRNIVY